MVTRRRRRRLLLALQIAHSRPARSPEARARPLGAGAAALVNAGGWFTWLAEAAHQVVRVPPPSVALVLGLECVLNVGWRDRDAAVSARRVTAPTTSTARLHPLASSSQVVVVEVQAHMIRPPGTFGYRCLLGTNACFQPVTSAPSSYHASPTSLWTARHHDAPPFSGQRSRVKSRARAPRRSDSQWMGPV